MAEAVRCNAFVEAALSSRANPNKRRCAGRGIPGAMEKTVAGYLVRTTPTVTHQSLNTVASALMVAGIVIALLYIGRPILEPLVIAALLAFILTPVIRQLRTWGLWRIPAIILAVASAIAVVALLSATIVIQVAQLAEDLPKHEANIRAKVRALSASAPWSSRVLDRASGTLRELQKEVTREEGPASEQKPMPVEVRQPQSRGLEAFANLVQPLLSPLATTALVLLFLLFILLQREDIRDRFVRLAGTGDLQRTTAALNDAATRLSRFFLLQISLNVGFGVVIAVGLWLIGVPNAVLWGILAGLMRFVPYIGSFIAAFFSPCAGYSHRSRLDHGVAYRSAVHRHRADCRARGGATALRSAHWAVAGGDCRLELVLDHPVGTHRVAARHTIDCVSRRSWKAHRSVAVHRRPFGR